MNKVFIRTRNQLLFAFSCFTIIGVAIAVVSIYYFSKIHEIYQVTGSLHNYHDKYIKAIDSEQEFLSLDQGKPEYYKTGHSKYLEQHEKYLSEMKQSLADLKKKEAYHAYGIDSDIRSIETELSKYETLFGMILDKVKVKGFRDYGLEGKMSSYIYNLEKIAAPVGVEHVLRLRKYEKDYLLRNDPVYIKGLENQIDFLRKKIYSTQNLSPGMRETMLNLLQNYYQNFQRLVTTTKEIGYRDEVGLSELLNNSKDVIEFHFHTLYRKAEIKEVVLIQNLQSSFYIIIVNLVLVSLFLIYIFTRKISAPEAPKVVPPKPNEVTPPAPAYVAPVTNSSEPAVSNAVAHERQVKNG